MKKITAESSSITITLEPNKFINDGIHMDLGFRPKGSTGRAVVSVTMEDLKAIEQVVTELRNQLTMRRLKRGIKHARINNNN